MEGVVLVDAVLLMLLDILPVQSVLDVWRYGTRNGVEMGPISNPKLGVTLGTYPWDICTNGHRENNVRARVSIYI